MVSFWHSRGGMKNLAVGLLSLALAAIAAVHVASQKMIAIQGPGALQVIDGQTVWLGVNDDLWILDGQGHKTGQRTFSELGLTEAVSNIVLAPDQQALVTSRGDLGWQVVNTRDLSRVRTITPQWPADFRDNYLRAIHLAVSPQWDIAVGTGGGHAVLLFDRDGKFRARTPPGAFYFTNGLWHGPQGWWTTDTNRSTLRLLETETLAAKNSIQLTGELGGYAALGELIPSHGDPLPGTQHLPVATVSRLGFLMEPGYAVDVFSDGSHLAFNQEPLAKLRDMAWLEQNLLIVDGGEYQVLRFAADRSALPRFGDSEVNRALQQMRSDREFWANFSSRYMFLVAAVLLLAGIAAYHRHKKLAVRAVISARRSSPVGTLRQSRGKLVRQRLWIFGLPVVLRLAAAIAGLRFLLPWLLADAGLARQRHPILFLNIAMALSIVAPVFFVALWQQWRHNRLSGKPHYETTLNHKALAWLDRYDDWDQVSQPGEVPRETLYLPGWKPRWLLVTNQRVLLFAVSARERRLQKEWARRLVVFAGPPQNAPGARRTWLGRRLLRFVPNLVIAFEGGERLAIRCASAVTALRAAEVLMQGRVLPAQVRAAARQPRRSNARRRWHEVAASFLVPGLGQWLQDRFVTGTVLFTAGILLSLLGWGPVVWASHGPKMHVEILDKAFAALWWLALAFVAAADAFHFSATRKARR